MSGVEAIRRAFLEHFRARGHEVVASGPLVPRNDPTLLFTNAGMVQFKNVFTGAEKRPYQRATTAQKCLRAGGKHNDLDNVGYTARHHTFFEMMGNFSFGDYFKERAIELAWELITKGYGLPKDRLSVTVYADDDEAHGLWKRIAGLPEGRIIRIGTSDNFWSMGDTGPCGPCSEIFFDHGDKVPGGPPGSPDEDGDRFIEIWNLVFMQFEQTAAGRTALPRPSIDTGMGLERVAAVLQGTHDNYGTDLFRALIEAVAHATGVAPGGERGASHRVIADHLRAVGFLIADGVLPSNEGRGYVLRRIARRAMRHAELLGAREPVLFTLVPELVAQMGAAYPELARAQGLISETIQLEEERFRRTLTRGLALLEEEVAALAPGAALPGAVAFKLYDTYGFPLDLTQDALRERGLCADEAGFKEAMERQRADARAAWSGTGDAATDALWFALRERLGATEFLGHETEEAEGVVLALVRDGAEVERLRPGETGLVVLNQTPFYAESGGQVGDTGDLEAEGLRAKVTDTTKRLGDLFLHRAEVREGELRVGRALALKVDHGRRLRVRGAHSATHLLHEALREVLGEHVAQKGSLVEPERLRFDVSHGRPMTETELRTVEDLANAVVMQNAPVETRLMSQEAAVASGARALFGEKYGEEVRVVAMGRRVQRDDGSLPFSVELCGGTHAARTGDVGLIAVVGEAGVSAGVRRVEALTGGAARHHLAREAGRARAVAEALRAKPEEVVERVAALVEERRRLERELAEARRRLAMAPAAGEAEGDGARDVAGVRFLGRVAAGVAPRDLKGLADEAKKRVGSGVVALVGVAEDGRAAVVVGVTADLTARYDAVALVRRAAEALGGAGGGGRPDMAQAGGPDGARAQDALEAVAAALAGAGAAAA